VAVRVRPLVVLVVIAAGCVREPVEQVCPDIAGGDLVVTEVRGIQNPEDPVGSQWVEVYNASGKQLDLIGTKIRFRRKDGSSEVATLVRRSLPLAAGAYVVLGKGIDGEQASHIDYAFGFDFADTWLGAAAIDVETCGVLVDRAVYDTLPRTGTFSLGTNPPNADANDLPAEWCEDPTPAGTPKQANAVCPP
jgi:hypothetical protein